MQKAECETAIRHLCHEWRRAEGMVATSPDSLSFGSFYRWVQEHHPRYLDFRSTGGPREAAERWFNQEFGQSWRE